ncbi:Uncharacterized protein (Fragment) [Durusdinium trenchii]|uniref:Uncharacterized protein n=1 Tax=Durusdinium trenchii TaxID=1381693 RepID=A0ABP0SN79_9DINO
MSTSYRSDRPFPRKPQQRQAFAAEVEEEEPHEETHEDEPDEQYSLEEVLQAEAEILATELEEAVDDGIGPDIIQDVEETVESAAEALLTMREARSKLAESPKKHPKSVKVVETMNTEHVVADPALLPAVDGNEALAVSCVSRNLNSITSSLADHASCQSRSQRRSRRQRDSAACQVDKKHASLQDKLGTYGGKTQEENGIVPKGTFQKAELWQAWTVSNMSDCIWLRNRMGIRYAFLEDPILMGMLAAKSAKGLTARVKKESIAEAVEKAHQSQMQGTADQEARAMIGPRGGLPTLRSDLLRLAALLHVHIGEKDTVPVIKEKLKPMVEALKGRTPAADSRASSSTAQPPPVRLTSAPVQKPAAKPPPRAIQSFTPQPCEVLHQTRSMAALEQLLKQVSAAVEQIKDQPYSMQTQGTMPQQHSLEQASDVSMNDLDAEAQRQLMEDAALSMEAVYEEKLEAQYGEWGMLELTPEQKERAWEKHRRDQLSRFGVETAKINQALQTEFENEMNSFVNDEVYTNTQRVMREAARRGHRVGTPMSLETGWNFLDADHREAAKRLNSSVNLEEILEKGRILMRFALELAAIQHEAGDWEEAIREAVASALHDMTRSGLPARPQEVHDQPIPEESEWPPVPISESESPSTESPDGEPLPAHPAFPTVGETPPVKPRERQPSSDLPPVHPREMVNALQSGTEASVSRLPSHSGVMASRLTTPMTRQNTPMAAPPLFAGASSSSAGVLGAQIERARLLEKRPAEMETEELRSLASSQAAFERPVGQPGCEPELHDTLVVSKEDVMSVLEQGDKVHPLIKLYCEACVDRANPLDAQVHDHVKFNVDFIKGKSKGTKGKPAAAWSEGNLPGEPLPVSHPVFPYLHQLGDRPGWHFDGDLAINVARDAKSFRSPAPRCDVKKFHLRSTFGRFDHEAGASEWRALEEEVDLNQLANLQQLIGATADSMEQLRWNFAATNFQVAISACHLARRTNGDAAGAADLARQLLRRWPCWSLEGFNSAVSAQRGIYWQQVLLVSTLSARAGYSYYISLYKDWRALELLDRAEELQLQLDLITYSAAISVTRHASATGTVGWSFWAACNVKG